MLDAMGALRSERGRAGRIAAALGFAGVVAATAGWVTTDALERDDDFCTSCHLPSGTPLHQSLRSDYDERPYASLAARHAGAPVAGRIDSAFRCIDCHGGASLAGRLRVKALAAKDAFWYMVGRFEEPAHMAWPLWDEDCRKCHGSFAASGADDWAQTDFHALPVHNAALGVACVACHRSHDGDGNPDAYFLHAASVRSQCALCHSEFEEE